MEGAPALHLKSTRRSRTSVPEHPGCVCVRVHVRPTPDLTASPHAVLMDPRRSDQGPTVAAPELESRFADRGQVFRAARKTTRPLRLRPLPLAQGQVFRAERKTTRGGACAPHPFAARMDSLRSPLRAAPSTHSVSAARRLTRARRLVGRTGVPPVPPGVPPGAGAMAGTDCRNT